MQNVKSLNSLTRRCMFAFNPITKLWKTYLQVLDPVFEGKPHDATEENLQARIRGNLLMALSNKFGHLVLTTGNKSEMSVGYATLYGDMAGGFAVLSDIFKHDVYGVSRFINDVRERREARRQEEQHKKMLEEDPENIDLDGSVVPD